MWNNLLECLSKVLVEVQEVFFKRLFLLSVELCEQELNTFFSSLELLSLGFELLVLLEVLFVPLLTVTVLSWELVKLLARLMNQLLYLSLIHFLSFCLLECQFIESTQLGDDCLGVLTYLDRVIDPDTSLFNGSCLLTQKLKLILVESSSRLPLRRRIQSSI